MMNEMAAVEKVGLFAGQVHCAYGMSMWCFGEERNLYYSTCPFEKEFQMFLEFDGCLDYAYKMKEEAGYPVVVSDYMGLTWVVDYIRYAGGGTLTLMLGPVFISNTSIKDLENSLREMNLSITIRRGLLQILLQVPVIKMSNLQQYAMMLHYTITGEECSKKDILYQASEEKRPDAVWDWEKEEFPGETVSDSVNPERKRMMEHLLLQQVREGNLNFRDVLDQNVSIEDAGDFQVDSRERNAKNTLIIFTALCSRAAVEGGLSPRTAQVLEQQYIGRIEKCGRVSDLMNIYMQMLEDFITRVHRCKSMPEISKPIQECCDYIQANLTRRLELEDLASQIGYSGYYLTKKFKKEMGIRLMDYIKEKRIEYAKILLVTTNRGIEEISDSLQFSNRSYFSQVFREITGHTPAAYRQRAADPLQ